MPNRANCTCQAVAETDKIVTSATLLCRMSTHLVVWMQAIVEAKLPLLLPMVARLTRQAVLVPLAKMLMVPMHCTVRASLQLHRYA